MPLVPLVVCHWILIHWYKAVRGYTINLNVWGTIYLIQGCTILFQFVDHGCATAPRQQTAHTTKRIDEQNCMNNLSGLANMKSFFYSVRCTDIIVFFLFPVQRMASCPKIKSHHITIIAYARLTICVCLFTFSNQSSFSAASNEATNFWLKRSCKGHCCIGYTVIIWMISSEMTR